MLDRIGWYSWSGPALVRMTRTKYFNPKIDLKSLDKSYDLRYLERAKKVFGITDAWVMYSWGFGDRVEKEDHEYILERLQNFKKQGIKVHAYLQGPNLVYDDFNEDYWCRDEKGRYISYYKGRRVACVNNPKFQRLFFNRLKKLLRRDFDGVFIDNLQMGQLGIPVSDGKPFVFAGCRCRYCQKKYRVDSGKEIPRDFEDNSIQTKKYLEFRSDSLVKFVSKAYDLARRAGKEFGVNNYDPKFDTKLIYGYDLTKMAKYQDYLLFENHAFSKNGISNSYIEHLGLKKPVFVVSYENGIGYESQYSQRHFDLIYSEAKKAHFFPLLKASEFKTDGVWHNLRLGALNRPRTDLEIKTTRKNLKTSKTTQLLRSRLFRWLSKRYYNPGYTAVMEKQWLRPVMKVVYELVLH